MNKLYLLFFVIPFCLTLNAQGFKVKEMKTSVSDISASVHPREDSMGKSCGLVKVLTKIPNVEFGEAVVGGVENKTNEYWVYLPKGSRDFVIMRPDYLPMRVMFADYGVDSISAKTTYVMTLKENNLNAEKCGVTFQVKPREAKIVVDNMTLKPSQDGGYKLLLPKGEHLCSFSAEGYKPVVQTVITGKGIQNIGVEMESLLADVNIVCQTGTAELFIDNEFKGIGGWKGKLLPGSYIVEARQKGYKTETKRITLAEKDKRSIGIPSLQIIKGSLNITTTPSGCKVYLDGEFYEYAPCVIKDVIYGNHVLQVELDSCGYYGSVDSNVTIDDETIQNLSFEIISNQNFNYYRNAFEWFVEGYKHQCRGSEGNSTGIEERDYYDKIMNILDGLDVQFLTKRIKARNLWENIDDVIIAYAMIDDYCALIPLPEKAVIIADKIKCQDALVLEKIANTYAMMSNYKTAIEWFIKAYEYGVYGDVYENFSNYLNRDKHHKGIVQPSSIGICYLLLGNITEANKWFQKVTIEKDRDVDYIIFSFLSLGYNREALSWYNKALQLPESFAGSKRALKEKMDGIQKGEEMWCFEWLNGSRDSYEVTFEYGSNTRATQVYELFCEFEAKSAISKKLRRDDIRILKIRKR